jgi:hypothetical protein
MWKANRRRRRRRRRRRPRMVVSTTGVGPPSRMLMPTASGASMVRASTAR